MKFILTNQDASNKIIVYILLIFFMTMYTISFVTGKPLDLRGMLGFLLPILTHGSHLLTNFLNQKTSVQAASTDVTPEKVAAMKQAVVSSSQSLPVINGNGGDHASGI